jgi:hypothetical protein
VQGAVCIWSLDMFCVEVQPHLVACCLSCIMKVVACMGDSLQEGVVWAFVAGGRVCGRSCICVVSVAFVGGAGFL